MGGRFYALGVMRWYQQLKNVYHLAQAHWWRAYFGRPDRDMKIYGVTGTNGKTTTCYLLASILRAAFGKEKVGMLSTVGIWIGEKESINETKMTTTDSAVVYRHLRWMRECGVEHVVLEMTSHALDQNRLAGMTLSGAIILNIEREHLDYHGTMEEYALAKAKIIDYVQVKSPVVVREDVVEKLKNQNSKIKNVRLLLFTAEQAQGVSTPLPGDWNKENALAAGLLAEAVGVEKGDVERGVESVKQVPGRMEFIKIQNPKSKIRNNLPLVLIDYAVTPGALNRLYRHVRAGTAGKIYAVLGAAGRRDRGKRPDMARAVARYADEIVLTREDPGTEDEEQIFSDLEKGLVGVEVPWCRIIDRREAIKYALGEARSGDVVVATGKGAETGMAVGRKIIPWSDREIICELLEEIGASEKRKEKNAK